ncbi:MAG TPA: glycosyltransferase [Pirellulaceae bacterium]|nr:glycosyltransferase [Pirellulaceae bacterium]
MKVSVAIITFNHARFIGPCLDSVLDQDFGDEYEIVVSDDCSTDGTREIVRDYAARYPDRIRPLLRERNLGRGGRNLAATMLACDGQYIATLEGDDFWIRRDKLSRQVAFLDSHPDYAACYSDTLSANEHGQISSVRFVQQPDRTYDLDDVLQVRPGSNVAIRSLMYRRETFAGFPPWVQRQKMADKALTVLLAQHGKLKRFGEPLAVHRYHPGGLWTTLAIRKQRLYQVRYFRALHHWIDEPHRPPVARQLKLARLRLAWALIGGGSLRRGLRMMRALRSHAPRMSYGTWWRVWAQVMTTHLKRRCAALFRRRLTPANET